MDPLRPLINALHEEGRLRVWSLVITIFGDSVLPRGGRVPTARLRALLSRVGVEDGALRTALSRLGNDGWVVSERQGRNSVYQLSGSGKEKFAPATGVIYAPPAQQSRDGWAIWLGPTVSGAFALGPDIWLGRNPPRAAADLMVFGQLSPVSDRIADRLMTEPHKAAIAALVRDLNTLESISPKLADAAAARTLLVHRWRRLVLRFPELPNEVLPAEHIAHDLRARVARAYLALCPQADAWLSGDADGLSPMPAPTQEAQGRFKPMKEA